MASSTSHPLIPLLLLLALLFLPNVHPATTSCYTSIFSFGDSVADTGNFLHYANWGPESRLPYGETYFHHPTGRFSDGRLIIDFTAQAIGVPLVPPYLAGPGDHGFRRGANFAVGGATALDNDFFRDRGLEVYWTEYSLATQIDWFKQLLPSLCSSDSGFDEPLAACCGGGGTYNFNLAVMCGAPGDTVCSDPSKHVCWDGMHLTDAAYEIIARGMLEGSYASAPITQACLQLEPDVSQLQRVF